jgi:hypothetical protein
LDKVLAAQPHVISGKAVRVHSLKQFMLLIEGFSPVTTKESLLDHFSNYRSINHCVVIHDQHAGTHKAFVGFSSQEEVVRKHLLASHPNFSLITFSSTWWCLIRM